MKTKSLAIALIAGIFVLAFTSCEKEITDARIKIMEVKTIRLEKHYKDMTRTEFNETFRDYKSDLKDISKRDLTKNQKEDVAVLKWRLCEVWIQYNNPFSEVRIVR